MRRMDFLDYHNYKVIVEYLKNQIEHKQHNY